MRRFDYLIRRLARSRLNRILALVFLAMLGQALLAPRLFSYRDPEIRQTEERGFGRFQFHGFWASDQLLPKYDQAETTNDLNRYLSWLRSEAARVRPGEDSAAWSDYLQLQQRIHTQTLRDVTGAVSAERYYQLHYLEPILMAADFPESLFPANPGDPDWQAAFEDYLEVSLTAPSARVRARALNIRGLQPLRLDHFSASAFMLDLRVTGKALLLLVPFLALLVLCGERDRNRRRETPGLILSRGLATALYSAAALLLLFAALYLFLSIRHGDAEGAMHILPVWGKDDPEAILTLRRHLFQVAAMDLLFLLFASLLLSALWSVFRDPWAAGGGALGLLLLPSLVTSPTLVPDRFFTPLHYLYWEVEPLPFSYWGLFRAPYTAGLAPEPLTVLTTLLAGILLLVPLLFASDRIRQLLRAASGRTVPSGPKQPAKETANDHSESPRS